MPIHIDTSLLGLLSWLGVSWPSLPVRAAVVGPDTPGHDGFIRRGMTVLSVGHDGFIRRGMTVLFVGA
jgi:hypothetical protein